MLKTKLAACVLALALASIGSCKGFLDVENPGPIEDENLSITLRDASSPRRV